MAAHTATYSKLYPFVGPALVKPVELHVYRALNHSRWWDVGR